LAGGLWGSKSFVSLPVRRCSVPTIAPLDCADPFYLGLLDRPRFNGRWRCGSLGGISWVHRRPVREVDEHLERARTTQCSSDRKSGLLLTKLHNFRCSLEGRGVILHNSHTDPPKVHWFRALWGAERARSFHLWHVNRFPKCGPGESAARPLQSPRQRSGPRMMRVCGILHKQNRGIMIFDSPRCA
jgi:hypothetical protein